MNCKIRASMKINLLLSLLVVCFVSVGGPAYAEKADKLKPMNIEADAARYDDLKQTNVFTGKVVYFKQKRDGLDEYIEGEGETIEYSSKLDNVRFIKRAILRRLVGSKVNDEITGELIVYDNTTDVFTVDSGSAGSNPGGQNGRVRAMLTPKAAASAASGTAPAGQAPVLRSTTTLEGVKK
jgi:lipopolysaccharide export system protein LptA